MWSRARCGTSPSLACFEDDMVGAGVEGLECIWWVLVWRVWNAYGGCWCGGSGMHMVGAGVEGLECIPDLSFHAFP
jgi:hypothetical protein